MSKSPSSIGFVSSHHQLHLQHQYLIQSTLSYISIHLSSSFRQLQSASSSIRQALSQPPSKCVSPSPRLLLSPLAFLPPPTLRVAPLVLATMSRSARLATPVARIWSSAAATASSRLVTAPTSLAASCLASSAAHSRMVNSAFSTAAPSSVSLPVSNASSIWYR